MRHKLVLTIGAKKLEYYASALITLLIASGTSKICMNKSGNNAQFLVTGEAACTLKAHALTGHCSVLAVWPYTCIYAHIRKRDQIRATSTGQHTVVTM